MRPWRLNARLSEAQQRELVARFKAGTPKRVLAQEYGISESGVRYLLRQHGVRDERWPKSSA
jgi:hypothetical protein